MTNEHDKGTHEANIFRQFIPHALKFGLHVCPDSVRKNPSPAGPDILCRDGTHADIGFELTEICDTDLACEAARVGKSGASTSEAIRTTTEAVATVSKKLKKNYCSNQPNELLCYTNGRSVTIDDVILGRIRDTLKVIGHCSFRRIWLFGDDCHLVHQDDSFETS